MLVTVNCLLTASPSSQSHLTRVLHCIHSQHCGCDLLLASGSSSVNISPSILCSLSPLLHSLLSSTSTPTTLILPELSPGSLHLARECLYTGQCRGSVGQLEDAVKLLGLLGIQIRNEVDGKFEVGKQTKDSSFILGVCDSTENTMEEIVDETLPGVDDILNETKNKEIFASFVVGDQTCREALNLSDIQVKDFPSFGNETMEECQGLVESDVLLGSDKQLIKNCKDMEFVELFEEENMSYKQESSLISKEGCKKLVDSDILLSDDDLKDVSNTNLDQEADISSTNVLKGKSFPCNQCDYVASQNGHLKRHVSAKHSNERFECKECEKKFTLKESLRRHVKEVHGNYTFPCPECNFVGRRQDSLNYHLQWKHSVEKSTCDECGYEAETERLIQRHKLRVHRGVKHPCVKCDYVTADKSSLSYHMKSTHEKIRYKCDVCTRKFTKSTSLKKHIDSVHMKS